MARPRKQGLDYFPHDVDCTTDPKLEPAILRFGAAAYAFYFVHLEYCYRSDDLSVDVSDGETGAEMREVIQRKLHISPEDYDGILKSLLRHGAFDADIYAETGHLTSNGIKKRAGKVFEKRERDNKRYELNISAPISDVETIVETTQRKAKNSKQKDIKEEKELSVDTPTPSSTPSKPVKHKHGTYGWVKLSEAEYERLIKDFGEPEVKRLIQYIDEYAQSTGNKQKYKDWNLVIRKAKREGWGQKKFDQHRADNLAPRISSETMNYDNLYKNWPGDAGNMLGEGGKKNGTGVDRKHTGTDNGKFPLSGFKPATEDWGAGK